MDIAITSIVIFQEYRDSTQVLPRSAEAAQETKPKVRLAPADISPEGNMVANSDGSLDPPTSADFVISGIWT